MARRPGHGTLIVALVLVELITLSGVTLVQMVVGVVKPLMILFGGELTMLLI